MFFTYFSFIFLYSGKAVTGCHIPFFRLREIVVLDERNREMNLCKNKK